MKRLRYKSGDIDVADYVLIKELAANARASLTKLSRATGLSSPTVSERIKRLEENGVINGYTISINYQALGRPIAAWLRIRPVPGQLQKVAALLKEMPDIVECNRITGEDCFLARTHVKSMQELETLIDKIIPYSITNTSIIQSSPIETRLPDLRLED